MTDEKVKEEFEKWLRSYCFQAPPERDYLLMKDTWAECSRTAERLAKIEVLEKLIGEYGYDIGGRAMTEINRQIIQLIEGGN